MPELANLLEAVRTGQAGALSREQVFELLAWLAGQRAEAGSPEADPVLQQMVLIRLDAALFRDGVLNLDAAGVGPDVPATQRKVRFRRLAGVFHPDRFPALSEWLTIRSQAVHAAYGRFKKNPDEVSMPASVARVPSPSTVEPIDSTPRRKPGAIQRNLLHLRRRFGHDRYLTQKLIAGLALIALLPVLNLLLAPSRVVESDGSGAAVSSALVESASRSEEMVRSSARDSMSASEPSSGGERGRGLVLFHDEAGVAASDPVELQRSAPEEPASGTGRSMRDSFEASSAPSLQEAAREALQPGRAAQSTLPSVDLQLAALGLQTDDERLNRRFEHLGPPSDPYRSALPSSRPTNDLELAPDPLDPTPGDAEIRAEGENRSVPGASERRADSNMNGRDSVRSNEEPARGRSARVASNDGSIDAVVERPRSPQGSRSGSSAPQPREQSGRSDQSAVEAYDQSDPESVLEIEDGRSRTSVETARNERGGGSNAEESAIDSRISQAAGTVDDSENTLAQDASDQRASPPVPEPGRLTLGPVGFHPAGDLLAAFKTNIESGDVLALRALFGNQRAVDRFVHFVQTHPDRAVDLQVHAMQRRGNEWLIELDMQLRSSTDQRDLPGTRFRLAQQNDRLRIVAIDP